MLLASVFVLGMFPASAASLTDENIPSETNLEEIQAPTPGVTVSDTADENGLYDVTFTVDTTTLDMDQSKTVNEVYLYGSFARYPVDVTQWQNTHANNDEADKMSNWYGILDEDGTIPGVVIPSEYASNISKLDGTAFLEQPTYAQPMTQIGNSTLWTVTLKLPASPYWYRYAVNPKFGH
jgi:hypothetical protein